MFRFRPFFSLLAVILLAGCAEAELASHAWKTYDPPPSAQGTFKVGNPYSIQGTRYTPQERYDHSETGIASWYGPGFHGKKTANGEVFNKNELTAAHRTLQMPSLIRVTNLQNGRSLIVRVNDRGPFSRGRVLDLSERAAELLAFKNQGTARVKIEVLPEESRRVAELARQGRDTRGYEVALNRNRVPVSSSAPPREVVLAQQQVVHSGGAPVPSVQRETIGSVPVHQGQGGVVYPDPVVQQVAVAPTNLYVQAGSFSSEANALALSRKLSTVGPTRVYPATVSGQTFYRVRLGPYEQVAMADSALNGTVSAGVDDARIIVD